MDFVLTAEESAFAERFEDLCRERIAPRARDADLRGAIPDESLADLTEAGFFGLFHDASVGGTGARGPLLGAVMESLGCACAGTLWSATISTALCGKILDHLCRPVHRERWLAPIARGERLGCFAAGEEGAGTDPGSYRATLRRAGRGFTLRGEKLRVANAPVADVAVVLARTEGPGSGLGYAVVDLRKPGITRASIGRVGLRAMPWGRIRFDDIELDEEDVILDATMERTLMSVGWGQLIQSFASIGIARAALEASLAHARDRRAFGRPIAHLPIVHGRLADMHLELEAARLLALRAITRMAPGAPGGDDVMIAKVHATEMGVRVTDAALRIFAGPGFSTDQIVERLHRDSLGSIPGGLPTDRLRDLIMCPALGVSPWEYEPFERLPPSLAT